MNTLARSLRLLRLFWSTALHAEMEYRLNFFFAALTSLVNFIGSLFTLSLFYRNGSTFTDWPWPATLLVVAMFTILDGFSSTFLTPNLNKIVTHVQKGTLDFILLKPCDSQFFLSTRNISPWGFPPLVLGLGLLVYAGRQLDLPPTAYLLALLPMALSLTILYSLWYILGTLTIWFVKIFNVTEVFRNMMEAGKFPIAAYPALPRFIFTFILPVAFLTTVPAQAMLGVASWRFLLAQTALALSLFAFSRWFWRFALRSYTSASS